MKDASESAERLNRISEYDESVTTNDIEIVLDYEDPGFLEYLHNNDPYASTKIDIIVDGMAVLEGGIGDFAVLNCRQMLERVDDILHGEEVRITYSDTPFSIVFYPEDAGTILITIADYDFLLGSPKEVLISKEAFAEELIATSRELYEFVGETNPALLKDTAVISLDEAIEDAKQSLKAY